MFWYQDVAVLWRNGKHFDFNFFAKDNDEDEQLNRIFRLSIIISVFMFFVEKSFTSFSYAILGGFLSYYLWKHKKDNTADNLLMLRYQNDANTIRPNCALKSRLGHIHNQQYQQYGLIVT